MYNTGEKDDESLRRNIQWREESAFPVCGGSHLPAFFPPPVASQPICCSRSGPSDSMEEMREHGKRSVGRAGVEKKGLSEKGMPAKKPYKMDRKQRFMDTEKTRSKR